MDSRGIVSPNAGLAYAASSQPRPDDERQSLIETIDSVGIGPGSEVNPAKDRIICPQSEIGNYRKCRHGKCRNGHHHAEAAFGSGRAPLHR